MTKHHVVLATNNAKKLVELRRVLAAATDSVEVLGLGDFDPYPEPAETEATFEENALIKARACLAATGLPALADDSGLCVDALNGMPGVLSARWSGVPRDQGGDQANYELVLNQLSDTPTERRGAYFACAMALCLPDGTEYVKVGTMAGAILTEPAGDGGFGYDPIFAADGYDISVAQIPAEDKDSISHRGQALRLITPDLIEAVGRNA